MDGTCFYIHKKPLRNRQGQKDTTSQGFKKVKSVEKDSVRRERAGNRKMERMRPRDKERTETGNA